MTNLDRTLAFLASFSSPGGPDLTCYAPDVVQREFPNRLVADGATRDLAALRAGAERGKQVVQGERYEVVNAVAHGDEVALEVIWTARLRVPLGKLAAGDVLRAYLGMFLTWRDGKIVAQRNYDCFEPF